MEVGTVKLVYLEDEIRGAYLDYAMSVITARALPDVRDGLKPVQRRILYAMHELGLRPGSPHKKSARIVGEVLGKYHPHGDSPVYEAMVRLAQDFSMRYILVDGQGNFGSVDGDPAAAQRYTEARLAPVAEEVLADIDRDTVDFGPNFDGTLQEPLVLPARLPNLLVNGASGIAVGMATNIPPHNVGEVVDALAFIIDRFASAVDAGVPFDLVWERIHGASLGGEALISAAKALPRPVQTVLRERIAARAAAEKTSPKVTPEALGHALLELADEKADVTPDELMAHIKGPDFPTGGTIIGAEGIKQAYTTGRGRVTVRAKVHTEDIRGNRQALVVGELPYQVNKANLIEKIADLIRDRRIEGISDIRDESDREGMRLVIELKRDVAPRQVMNQLYKHTALQSAFSTNMVALVDGQPRVLTLKAALLHYVSFRREVVTRRAHHELNRARQRAHILEGLKIALDNLDAVIATIRASRDAETARDALMRKFKLTEVQAQAILDMQLRRLAALEREKILAELAEVKKVIGRLEDLLAHPIKILRMVAEELQALKQRFGDPRRTAIVEKEIEEFTDEDLIPEQEVVVVVSARDYVKRMPADAYRARGRSARGQVATSSHEDDAVQHLLVTRTHYSLLFFTNQGRAFQVKAHELPEASRQARGLPLANLIRLAGGETVTAVLSVPEFDQNSYICLLTRGGEVKRLAASDLASARTSGLMVVSVPEGDELGWARLTRGRDELVLCSAEGQAIRFREDDVRPSGRGSGGVRAFRLEAGDRVAAADIVEPGGELVLISQRGVGKRVPLTEFPAQGRGGGGVRAFAVNARTGSVAAARVVGGSDDLLVISAEGTVAQTAVDDIAQKTRATQGAPVVALDAKDRVVAVARLRAEGAPNGANGKSSDSRGAVGKGGPKAEKGARGGTKAVSPASAPSRAAAAPGTAAKAKGAASSKAAPVEEKAEPAKGRPTKATADSATPTRGRAKASDAEPAKAPVASAGKARGRAASTAAKPGKAPVASASKARSPAASDTAQPAKDASAAAASAADGQAKAPRARRPHAT